MLGDDGVHPLSLKSGTPGLPAPRPPSLHGDRDARWRRPDRRGIQPPRPCPDVDNAQRLCARGSRRRPFCRTTAVGPTDEGKVTGGGEGVFRLFAEDGCPMTLFHSSTRWCCHGREHASRRGVFFSPMSKRRRGYPSETKVKRGEFIREAQPRRSLSVRFGTPLSRSAV